MLSIKQPGKTMQFWKKKNKTTKQKKKKNKKKQKKKKKQKQKKTKKNNKLLLHDVMKDWKQLLTDGRIQDYGRSLATVIIGVALITHLRMCVACVRKYFWYSVIYINYFASLPKGCS